MKPKLSQTSCKFRQAPIGRLKMIVRKSGFQAANDNLRHLPSYGQATQADDLPSLVDVGPILAVMAISAGTLYSISGVVSGYLQSLAIFYP